MADRHSRSDPAGVSLPPQPAALSPSREVAVMERPSKRTCLASGSTSTASSGRYVWADLMNNLLHQIILLFSSFHEFLAVTSTCRSWRAAVSSFSPIYSFNFPPLHLKIGVHHAHRSNFRYSPISNYKWQLRDPSRKHLSLRCSAPRNTPNYMRYLGCSYGYLIFICGQHCLLVDAYTASKVKPPKLVNDNGHEIYYGILVSPLSSPNSCLLLFLRKSMFQWQVGTNSWTEYPLDAERILQIVFFKGQIFAMDSLHRLYTISLAPQLSMREVAVWGDNMVPGMHCNPWLVVCGGMLLMVNLLTRVDKSNIFFKIGLYHEIFGLEGTFHVYRLDFSAGPAIWVKMDKLENWALFLSLDRRSPTFSCMNPERWGGKSNYIYIPSASGASNEPWITVKMGQSVSSRTHPVRHSLAGCSEELESLWVLPSLVYGVGY